MPKFRESLMSKGCFKSRDTYMNLFSGKTDKLKKQMSKIKQIFRKNEDL